MAFCNACGATLEPGAKFCNKCGATSAAAPAAVSSTISPAPAAPAQGGGGALKIILIVVAVIVALIVLGVGTMGFIAWRIAKHSHVQNRDGHVTVQTPFGSVESTTDPAEAARNLGVDMYPGATMQKGSAADVTVAGMHTSAAVFESDDPAASVFEFYKSKFPSASVVSAKGDRYSIVSGDRNNMTTIHIESQGDKTLIQISKVTKPNASAN